MITPKPSESHTRNDKPNLCIARIEYKVLNAALYKILPGECRNRQVLQFNPPHRQKLPMRRKSCDTNICHLGFGKQDHQTLVHCLMDISITYIGPITIQFIPPGLNLSKMIPSIHITSIRSRLQGTMITLIGVPGSWHVHHHRFQIQC